MAVREDRIEHLLRRAGFGASPEELEARLQAGYVGTLRGLLRFEDSPDDVDSHISQPGYVGVTARGQFLPDTNITDARQRWLFRLVHTERPLQEKMALYWHHHFATAYSKIAGAYGGTEASRMMAAVPSEDPGGTKGHLELLREHALGNFRDLLVAVAKDPAMLVWLDGRSNVRARPQENFARELMELFTFGVGFYTEQDVYAGARVFTGWNLRRAGAASDPSAKYEFFYNAAQHDTAAKTFSFPVYPDGGRTIPARGGDAGIQDGLDLIAACAVHPETGRRLARRLWAFFVSETNAPSEEWVARISGLYHTADCNMRAVVRGVLTSGEFIDPANFFTRYSWPVEFVVRALKEVGWRGFSVNDALTPLANMGQQLFEPPDVNGWATGPDWFSTAGMLARMNFAAQLATNQRFALRDAARPYRQSPSSLLSHLLDGLSPAPFEAGPYEELLSYAGAGTANWSGTDAELLTKTAGLAHLIVGSPQYQFV